MKRSSNLVVDEEGQNKSFYDQLLTRSKVKAINTVKLVGQTNSVKHVDRVFSLAFICDEVHFICIF